MIDCGFYSGDVGTFFWSLDNGQWVRHAAKEADIVNAPKDIADAIS